MNCLGTDKIRSKRERGVEDKTTQRDFDIGKKCIFLYLQEQTGEQILEIIFFVYFIYGWVGVAVEKEGYMKMFKKKN